MNNLTSTIIHKGISLCLIVLFMFPLFSMKTEVYNLALLLLLSIIQFFYLKEFDTSKRDVFYLFLFASIPLLYISELIYATDKSFVWSVTERKMGLIFIPLTFYILKSTKYKIDIKLNLLMYQISSILLVIYSILSLLTSGLNSDYLETGGFAFAIRTTIEDLTHLHPTYFSMILALSGILNLIHLLRSKKYNLLYYINLLCFLLIISFLLLLAARMAIFAFLICICMIFWKEVNSKKLKYTFLFSILVLIGISVGLIPSLRERMSESFEKRENGTTIRSTIWDCSMSLAKDSWIFGADIERVQSKLNKCYTEKNVSFSDSKIIYNTHNQYLDLICTKGIVALSFLLLLMGYLFYYSKSSILLVSFSLICLFLFFTENFLDRQIGIFFFSIFGSLIFFKNNLNSQSNLSFLNSEELNML